ncbi:SDR family oxidoreductase [Spiractinospora alimapuensis]|uniref:SDR family NAD(P)-dependent oxidoreductase n=1 Tax=Spiractinospora alimapuensis TaxID=2820884 RepID=UPI001F3E48DD|nr:SDR family oxidoreductase [Spiractinospora alimapuensis]QVQ52278.1 SDR family oxidoreductase [Spiractinospora alimapuensis]
METPPNLPPDPFDLEGTAAVVVGAGSAAAGVGIGRACALSLSARGARVGLIDRNRAAAEETLSMVQAAGGEGFAVAADVGAPDTIREAMTACAEALGGVHVVVSNVGIVGPPGDATEVDLDEWTAALHVNVTGMATTARYAIPHLRAAGGGSIVNISSVSGLRGGYPHLSYATTKGALLNMTRAMATQHGPEGIRVNTVAPGEVYTPRVRARGLSEEMRTARRMSVPLRTEGDAWDAAAAVTYLVSPASRWVTGVVLPVDGGLSATLPLRSPAPRSGE